MQVTETSDVVATFALQNPSATLDNRILRLSHIWDIILSIYTR